MPFWPLLLRVLLIAALVLNGTGAAAGMHGTHASTMAADPASTSSARHACHEDAEAGMTVADEAPRTAMSDQAQHPAPDCCSQAACSCACMGAQAAAPPASVGDAEPRSDRLASLVLQSHVEPATLHLIRPPIG